MIILGGFVFQSLEIPEKVPFGGSQAYAKHRLLGGSRVIQAMGPDDRDITWSGRFQSFDAWSRARQVDAMRLAGQPVPLVIDSEFRLVLISEFLPDYERAYQVPYSITCVIVNAPDSSDSVSASLDSVISADIGVVSSLVSAFSLGA
jgi:hypothetical protein